MVYNYLKMSGATSVSQKFDAAKIAEKLEEWEAELNDELVLEQTLRQDSIVLLNQARVQYNETKDFVVEQRDKRVKLLNELKEKISLNKEHEEEAKEYSEYVNSPEYQEYCQNLREINALDKKIHELLVAEQRLGRPPVQTSQVCDCLDGCTENCECTGCPCECCDEVEKEE